MSALRRRMPNRDGSGEGEEVNDHLMGFAPGEDRGGGAGGRVDEFGNLVPDFSGSPDFPTPFEDYQPEEIAGSSDTPREVFGSHAPRSPGATAGIGGPDLQALVAQLPQGVEAQGAGMGDVPGSSNTVDSAPALNAAPQPMSAQAMPPAMAPNTAGSPSPRRVSSPVSLFTESSRGGLGQPGARFTGGRGLPGASAAGPTPTEQMLALLEALGL